MSQKIGPISLIYEEKPQVCDDCGEVRELRPYGPNNSMICLDCAMKDIIGTMAKILFGDVITEKQARESLIKRGKIRK